MALYRCRFLSKCFLHQRTYCLTRLLCSSIPRCKSAEALEKNDGEPNRKIKDEENVHLAKYNLGLLKRHVSIDTKKSYKPPSDVYERVQSISASVLADQLATDWVSTPITDPKLKFKLLTRLIDEFDHNVPNSILTDIKCVGDAVRFFESEVRATSTYEDLASRRDLPQNLSIQAEYVRFDPETDTLFGGKTAFPGSDTIVSSIKYRRKYSDIKNRKEKPGYVNYYYDY